MKPAIEHLRTLQRLRIYKYASASLFNTILGIGIIAAIFHVTHNPYATILISAVLGYIYSLITYHYIAFDGKGLKPPYARYAIIYGSAYFLNTFLTKGLMEYTHSFLYTQIIIIPLVATLQYVAARLWGFRKNIDHNRTT